MKVPFKTTYSDGDESVRVVGEMNPDEIRFNRLTREISLIIPDTYTREDIDELSWQAIKKLVLENGGSWSSKKSGIKFMIGKRK